MCEPQQIKGTRIMRFALIDRNEIAVDLYFLFKLGVIPKLCIFLVPTIKDTQMQKLFYGEQKETISVFLKGIYN